jgi:hypothetical protein
MTSFSPRPFDNVFTSEPVQVKCILLAAEDEAEEGAKERESNQQEASSCDGATS